MLICRARAPSTRARSYLVMYFVVICVAIFVSDGTFPRRPLCAPGSMLVGCNGRHSTQKCRRGGVLSRAKSARKATRGPQNTMLHHAHTFFCCLAAAI